MIQIAIVEDDPAERARLRACLGYFEETEKLELHISEFADGMSFIGNYQPEYDIVLMDIEMPRMDGMEAARSLRTMDSDVILIFVTNMAQYAISGYEVEALDFILKPINQYSFALKMKRAVARTTKRNDEYITVKTERDMCSVRIASIRYLEVSGHYVIYHTTGGDYTEYATLKDAYGKINRTFFVHASRSFLINLKYVDAVSKDTVTVGGTEIQISRPQKKVFLAAMAEFMGGRR